MNSIKFSITIPAYKDKYLKETIDSVLAQTYQNYEIVIVNDASPYDLDSIVSQYNDPRIRYFKNDKNCGAKNVVDNWNICLSYATGDYLICMGDDDNLTPRCLQDFAYLIKKYPLVDLFHARTEVIDDFSNHVTTLEHRPEWESVYSLIFNPRNIHLGDFLFKTNTLRKNGGFYKLPYGWQSDNISAFMTAAKHGLANTQEICFQYRGNGESISHDMNCIEDKIEAVRSATIWLKDFLNENKPKSTNDILLTRNAKHDLLRMEQNQIDDMLEFDIRKNFYKRCVYWFIHRQKYGISFKRYLICTIKALKYI